MTRTITRVFCLVITSETITTDPTPERARPVINTTGREVRDSELPSRLGLRAVRRVSNNLRRVG